MDSLLCQPAASADGQRLPCLKGFYSDPNDDRFACPSHSKEQSTTVSLGGEVGGRGAWAHREAPAPHEAAPSTGRGSPRAQGASPGRLPMTCGSPWSSRRPARQTLGTALLPFP